MHRIFGFWYDIMMRCQVNYVQKYSREKKTFTPKSSITCDFFFSPSFVLILMELRSPRQHVMSVRLWKFLKIHRTDQTPAAISAVSAFPVERNMLCALRKLNNPGLPTQEAMPTSKYKRNLRGSIKCPRSITKVMLTNKKSQFCINIYVQGMFGNFFLRIMRKNKIWQAKEKCEEMFQRNFATNFFLNQEKYILHSSQFRIHSSLRGMAFSQNTPPFLIR